MRWALALSTPSISAASVTPSGPCAETSNSSIRRPVASAPRWAGPEAPGWPLMATRLSTLLRIGQGSFIMDNGGCSVKKGGPALTGASTHWRTSWAWPCPRRWPRRPPPGRAPTPSARPLRRRCSWRHPLPLQRRRSLRQRRPHQPALGARVPMPRRTSRRAAAGEAGPFVPAVGCVATGPSGAGRAELSGGAFSRFVPHMTSNVACTVTVPPAARCGQPLAISTAVSSESASRME